MCMYIHIYTPLNGPGMCCAVKNPAWADVCAQRMVCKQHERVRVPVLSARTYAIRSACERGYGGNNNNTTIKNNNCNGDTSNNHNYDS